MAAAAVVSLLAARLFQLPGSVWVIPSLDIRQSSAVQDHQCAEIV
jgi:hypothetical protein